MAVTSTLGTTAQPFSSSAMASTNSATLAQNFTTFLELLTTQLRNQNPLEPLDTNQFTQQLVQFAQVEQQMGMNASLNALIALQYATQASAAMSFLGATVLVEGDTAKLADGEATWSFTAEKAATATINVYSATGELVHTEERTITAGNQNFTWDGHGANGRTLPEGSYRVSITARDASGQTVSVSTEVEGVVDGIDVTQSPPVLTIGGQTFTVDKIKQVRRPAPPASFASRMASALPSF